MLSFQFAWFLCVVCGLYYTCVWTCAQVSIGSFEKGYAGIAVQLILSIWEKWLPKSQHKISVFTHCGLYSALRRCSMSGFRRNVFELARQELRTIVALEDLGNSPREKQIIPYLYALVAVFSYHLVCWYFFFFFIIWLRMTTNNRWLCGAVCTPPNKLISIRCHGFSGHEIGWIGGCVGLVDFTMTAHDSQSLM